MYRLRGWIVYVKANGISGFAGYLLRKITGPIFERCIIDVYRIDPSSQIVKPAVRVRVDRLDSEDSTAQENLPPTFPYLRLRKGHVCYIALLDGMLAHSSWLAMAGAEIGEIHRRFVLPKEDGYIYDSFTSSEHRGLGLFPHVVTTISNEVKTSTGGHTWIVVERDNSSSIRGIIKAGGRHIGVVHYARRMGLKSVRVEGALKIDEADGTICPIIEHSRGVKGRS